MLFPLDSLIRSACAWALHHAALTPKPLFASPALRFAMWADGQPCASPVSYLTRHEALTQSPDRLLDRAARSAPSASAGVCAYALTGTGQLYNLVGDEPSHLLVYLHDVPRRTTRRRLLKLNQGFHHGVQEADRFLPFDAPFLPPMGQLALDAPLTAQPL